MAVIFSASTDLGSTQHTSRIIAPVLRWFNPNVTEETIRHAQMVVRKTGHMSEYAILSLLLLRAFRNEFARRGAIAQPTKGALKWALVLGVFYACTDEFHQTFVPTREASVVDVGIDSTGAVIALSIAAWRERRRRYADSHRPTT